MFTAGSVHERLHLGLSTKPPLSTRTYTGCFPLHFSVISNAGRDNKDASIENILCDDDDAVYCSRAKPPVFIIFESAKPSTLTELFIRIPVEGYDNPAKDVQVFVYDEPNSEMCLLSPPLATLDIVIPLSPGCVKHVFSLPIHGVRSVLMVCRETYGNQGNVDLKHVAFGGFYGPHSFPHASFN